MNDEINFQNRTIILVQSGVDWIRFSKVTVTNQSE